MPHENVPNNEYEKRLSKLQAEILDKVAMKHYNGAIKGLLILVIDKNNVFNMMEGYGSDTMLAMNAALDIAKDSAVRAMRKSLEQAPPED